MKTIGILIALGLCCCLITIRAERIDVLGYFNSVDANEDGYLTFEESVNLLPKVESRLRKKVSGKEELKRYFAYVDTDGDRLISYAEFRKAVKEKLSKVIKRRNQF